VRVLGGDPGGLILIDRSIDGFFRSFSAFLLLVPLYVLIAIADHRVLAQSAGLEISEVPQLPTFVAAALVEVLDWIVFPLVMVPVARLLRLEPSYASFVTTRNWAKTFVDLAGGLPFVAVGFGLLTGPFGDILLIAGFAAQIFLRWRVAVAALPATASVRAAVVVLEVLILLLVNQLVLRLFGL